MENDQPMPTSTPRPRGPWPRALIGAMAAVAAAAGCGSDSGTGTAADTAAGGQVPAAISLVTAPLTLPTVATPAPPTAGAAPSAPTPTSSPSTTAAAQSKGSDGPSQSAADAKRDGVLAVVAELAPSARIDIQAELPATGGGRWVLSQLPGATVSRFVTTASGRLTGGDGPAAGDYGEVVLLGADGAIVRAWPMPGAPPNWLVVGDDRIYAGHDGDGGLPDSTLARIDPATFDATVVVIPAELDGTTTGWPSAWHVATGDDVFSYRGLIGYGSGGMTGARAASSLGDVVVSLSSVDGLINRVSGTAS